MLKYFRKKPDPPIAQMLRRKCFQGIAILDFVFIFLLILGRINQNEIHSTVAPLYSLEHFFSQPFFSMFSVQLDNRASIECVRGDHSNDGS